MALVPDDLAINRQERCPVVMVLDVSSSMTQDNRIEDLNAALQQFRDELVGDKLAQLRVEICIVAFGSTVEVVRDFVIAKEFEPPMLSANGMTPMGQAMDLALRMVEERKSVYRSSQVKYFRPWIWLMSDGMPNDDGWELAAARAVAAEASKKVKIFAVGIGADADLDALGKFATERPLRVQPGLFGEMFAWLSASLQLQSNSKQVSDPGGEGVTAVTASGEQIKLPPVEWGSID